MACAKSEIDSSISSVLSGSPKIAHFNKKYQKVKIIKIMLFLYSNGKIGTKTFKNIQLDLFIALYHK